jgi:XTP/dITP diphosphohydrolase
MSKLRTNLIRLAYQKPILKPFLFAALQEEENPPLRLNTSNANKLREFQQLGLHDLQAMRVDLPEPNADPLTVIRYKASQLGPNVLVEDTSFDVEGADIGTNIRWLLNDLPKYIGQKAIFRVLLGVQRSGEIQVFEGVVRGSIVEARGTGFGFDPVFLPDGATKTLGEDKPKQYNARAKAVQRFLQNRPSKILKPLFTWDGDFQHT